MDFGCVLANFHDYGNRLTPRVCLESHCEDFSLNYKQKVIAMLLVILFMIDVTHGSARYLCVGRDFD